MQKKNQMEFESKLISVMQKVENQKKQLSEIEKNTRKKFSIKDFFIKCGQIHISLRIYNDCLKMVH